MYSQLTIVSIASALAVTAVCAQDKPQLTVDELVAKNLAAKGGADALRALQSVRFTGKMLVNEGQLELAYVETKKRPGEVRTEATLQGMTPVQAYDGEQGLENFPVPRPQGSGENVGRRHKVVDRRRGNRRAAGRLEGKGEHGRVSRDGRRRRDAGAQAQSGAEEWRRHFCLSRS